MNNNTNPEIGDINISLMQLQSTYFVIVQKFKHNTLRGDSYWVTSNKLCRTFKTREAAENYVGRLNSLEK